MWVTAAVVGGALLLAIVTAAGVRQFRTETLGDVLAEIDGDIVVEDRMANFFGVTSAHPWQMRGNGCLILSTKEIYFQRWSPQWDLRFPRDAITRVELVKKHLGKRVGRSLLKLTWRTEEGEDSVAFLVSDPDAWVRELPVAAEVEIERDAGAHQREAAERARRAKAARSIES